MSDQCSDATPRRRPLGRMFARITQHRPASQAKVATPVPLVRHDVRSNPRVDFSIVGAQKSGTRALRHFLSAHPEIAFTTTAEGHYFDYRFSADRSGDYSVYHALFRAGDTQKVTGDVTPSYLYFRDVPARMWAYNPRFKIVVILRNPVERAYAQWAMAVASGAESASFLRTIASEPLRYRRHGQTANYSHVARGFYTRQLRRLFAVFPREQVLVLRNEELAHDHEATLRRIYRFLEVADVDPPAPARVHARNYPPMPKLARWMLTAVYAVDMRQLERMTGWDLASWRWARPPSRVPTSAARAR